MKKSESSNENENEKYHTISLRNDLPRIPKYYQEESLHFDVPNEFWMKKLTSSSSEKYHIHFSSTNGPYTSICENHPILTAFLRAYNSHEDIILSPDDLWLMICIYFAKYVNNNSTKFSHLFINNQTNRSITIENDQTIESNWENFLQQIHFEMTEFLPNNIVDLLQTKFSTTTKVESLLSSLTLMSTFKKSFDYSYLINSCGIRHVHFMGNLNDWILLRDKTDQLRLFNKDHEEFRDYIQGILPIFDQFIQTYQGHVDNQFWDTIFDLNHIKDESNQSDGISINGWFLRLCYGIHLKQTSFMTSIQLNYLIVPVQFENEHDNTSKTCYILGGFHGVYSYNEKHRPVMSLVILDDETSSTKLDI
ncbi:hypothetical protein I4U23_030289 [Adineta vaga]|nr:hypothetical protein I4U23_030289 [Adineta vaga]